MGGGRSSSGGGNGSMWMQDQSILIKNKRHDLQSLMERMRISPGIANGIGSRTTTTGWTIGSNTISSVSRLKTRTVESNANTKSLNSSSNPTTAVELQLPEDASSAASLVITLTDYKHLELQEQLQQNYWLWLDTSSTNDLVENALPMELEKVYTMIMPQFLEDQPDSGGLDGQQLSSSLGEASLLKADDGVRRR